MKSLLLVIFLISFFFANLKAQEKNDMTIIDSLYLFYSKEELKAMSFQEQKNAIRKMRGHNIKERAKDTDYLGIEILTNFNKDSIGKSIQQYVKSIQSNIDEMNKIIFPNSYIDVLNGYFIDFYENVTTRTLSIKDYKNYFFETPEGRGGSVGDFSNFSKRTYFVNEENRLCKVQIEYSFNINDGKKMAETLMQPIRYTSKEYFYQNDSLIFYQEKDIRQKIDKYYYLISQEELDTTNVNIKVEQKYFHRFNCFLNLQKKVNSSPENWKEYLVANELDTVSSCNNKFAIEGRNLIKELSEYKHGENEFLVPTQNSFLKPYEIGEE